MRPIILASVLFLISLSLNAMQFYSEFSMEQFDNGKPNGFIEFWKMECGSDSSCSLSIVAYLCSGEAGATTRPFLDFYSTKPDDILMSIRDLKIISDGKEYPSARNLAFKISQKMGPQEINCFIDVSKKSVIKVEEATCTGSGKWSADTKYKREWKLIKDGPFLFDKKCKTKIEFP